MQSRLLGGKRLLLCGAWAESPIARGFASRAAGDGAEMILAGELTHPGSFRDIADRVERRWAGLDGIVHAVALPACAGEDVPAPALASRLQAGIGALRSLTDELGTLLARSPDGGSIVCLESSPGPARAADAWTCAARAGFEGASRHLARELAPRVRVNLVGAAGGSSRRLVVNTACYLLSGLARHVSGEVIRVDEAQDCEGPVRVHASLATGGRGDCRMVIQSL